MLYRPATCHDCKCPANVHIGYETWACSVCGFVNVTATNPPKKLTQSLYEYPSSGPALNEIHLMELEDYHGKRL